MYELSDAVTTLKDSTDEENLLSLIEQHVKETDSSKGKEILSHWEHYKKCFKKIIPNDYLKIKNEISIRENEGSDHEQAVLEAFRKCTA